MGASTAVYDIEKISAETLFIVGEYGEMGKSLDGGKNWTALSAATTASLYSASFLNGTAGWVAGAGGFIAATKDGGNSWQFQQSGTPRNLNALQMIDANLGVAAGDSGTFLKTQDGGKLWLPLGSPFVAGIDAVFFLDKDTGWLAGATGIARTTDGGGQWTVQQPTQSFRSIYFINADTGWALHYFGALYRTFNGGATWQYESGLDGLLFHGYGIEFMDGQNGWAAGSYQVSGTNFDGKIFRTRDGGVTWQQWGQFQQVLFDVAFTDTGAAWCAGDNGALFFTPDGGSAWSSGIEGATGQLYAVHASTANVVCAVGGSNFDSTVILITTDGGATWTHRPAPVRNKRLRSVYFVNPSMGWVAGDDGTLMKTGDSGKTWASLSGPGAYDYNSVFFNDTLYGWAAAGNFYTSSRIVIRTRDGGASWQTVSTPVSFDFEDLFFSDSLNGFVVGSGGNILKTADGGKIWTQVGDSAFGPLLDVQFHDRVRGWITGTHKILRTVDSGITWQVWHEEPLYMTHSQFLDSVLGYAFAYSNTTPFPGVLLKTLDGGRNWQRESMNQGGLFQAGGPHFGNRDTGWVVSIGGTILKTENGGGVRWSIPSVDLAYPDGGEIFGMDSVVPIRWAAGDSSGITGVTFWLSIDHGKTFQLIDSVSGNAGLWNWTVRADTASPECLVEVRARDAEGYVGKDRSNGVFSITGTSTGVKMPGAPVAAGPLIAFSANPAGSRGKVYLTLPRSLDGKPFRLLMYDIRGRLIRTPAQGRMAAGSRAVEFISYVSAGVVFCVLESEGRILEQKKWVVTK